MAFRKAVRSNIPLLMSFASGTGGGKTYTALEVASGIVDVVGGRIGFMLPSPPEIPPPRPPVILGAV